MGRICLSEKDCEINHNVENDRYSFYTWASNHLNGFRSTDHGETSRLTELEAFPLSEFPPHEAPHVGVGLPAHPLTLCMGRKSYVAMTSA